MWIWLDKTGRVKQYLTHGPSPVVGETDFQIFAYFDGLNTDYFDSATIKFRKPDQQGSTYPVLFMRKVDMSYEYMPSDGSMSNFNESHGLYTGFLFDFSDFTEGDEIVRLLDTPGLWEATITVLGSPNKTNVSGLITFNVGSSTSDSEDQTILTLDQILENLVLAQRILKKNSTAYLKVASNFASDANNGLLDASIFSVGSVVLDETTKNFYKIQTITVNAEDETKVFATYVKAFEYLKIVQVDNEITLEQIRSIDSGNTILLRCNEKYYLAYVGETNNEKVSFEIRDLTTGKRYHGDSIDSSIDFATATSLPYYVPGTYYTPHVSEDGDLSWTNNNSEPNPPSVNIRGPQGIQGPQGEKGESAANAVWFEVDPETGHLLLYYSTESTVEDIYLVNNDASSPSYWQTLGVDQNLVGHIVFKYSN